MIGLDLFKHPVFHIIKQNPVEIFGSGSFFCGRRLRQETIVQSHAFHIHLYGKTKPDPRLYNCQHVAMVSFHNLWLPVRNMSKFQDCFLMFTSIPKPVKTISPYVGQKMTSDWRQEGPSDNSIVTLPNFKCGIQRYKTHGVLQGVQIYIYPQVDKFRNRQRVGLWFHCTSVQL